MPSPPKIEVESVNAFRRSWRAVATELQLEVFMYLSLPELMALASVPGYGTIVCGVLLSRMREILKAWNLGVFETLKMMEETNTIVSGSVALYLAFIGLWFPGDLDFYCPATRYDTVVGWFETRGYVLVPITLPAPREGPYEDVGGIAEVGTLVHTRLGCKINVIAALSTSPCTPVLFFHSTVVMNVITSKGLVCLYPGLTAVGKGLRNYCRRPHSAVWSEPHPREAVGFAKYTNRGYTISDGCSGEHCLGEATCQWCAYFFRTSSDDSVAQMPFKEDDEVTLAPRFQWRLGTSTTWRKNTIVGGNGRRPMRVAVSYHLRREMPWVVVDGEPMDSMYHGDVPRSIYMANRPGL